MTRNIRWAALALVALLPLGLVLPAMAQREKPPADVDHAREIAALIEQGQLSLTDATRIAEKHVKGIALRAQCTVAAASASKAPARGGDAPSGSTAADDAGETPARSSGDKDKLEPVGKRLIYEIACFAKAQGAVQVVRIDGLTRKPMDGAEVAPK